MERKRCRSDESEKVRKKGKVFWVRKIVVTKWLYIIINEHKQVSSACWSLIMPLCITCVVFKIMQLPQSQNFIRGKNVDSLVSKTQVSWHLLWTWIPEIQNYYPSIRIDTSCVLLWWFINKINLTFKEMRTRWIYMLWPSSVSQTIDIYLFKFVLCLLSRFTGIKA